MKSVYFLVLLTALTFQSAMAQTNNPKGEVFTVEALACDSLGMAIKDVAVYDAKNNIRSVTDRDGIARIATRLGETLYFSHLSFNTKPVRIEKKSLIEGDEGHYSMLVVMQHKTNTLKEVTVMENAPHLAYANKTVWVMDYKVQHDGIYMVAGNGKESVLLHLGFEQDTISRKPIAPKYQELYRDAFDNLHLMGSDSTYQIYCDGKQLHLLYGCKKEVFKQKLEPVTLLTDSIMVLQEYVNMQQQLVYLMVNRNNKQISVLADLTGTAIEMGRNAKLDMKRDQLIDKMEADFEAEEQAQAAMCLENSDALSNQSKELSFESDKNEEAEQKLIISDLYNRILFKPIYCPTLYIGGFIYIFDFQNNNMLKFDSQGGQISTCEIDFHKTGYFKNSPINNPWDKKMIVDEATNRCYTQFTVNGIVTLKEIDLSNGKVKREIRLSNHSFPQNIQIYNGEVYYLFLNNTQTVGRDRRSLYKMRLE